MGIRCIATLNDDVIFWLETVLAKACLALFRSTIDHDVLIPSQVVLKFSIHVFALYICKREITRHPEDMGKTLLLH